jgi:hypothetical protein
MLIFREYVSINQEGKIMFEGGNLTLACCYINKQMFPHSLTFNRIILSKNKFNV